MTQGLGDVSGSIMSLLMIRNVKDLKFYAPSRNVRSKFYSSFEFLTATVSIPGTEVSPIITDTPGGKISTKFYKKIKNLLQKTTRKKFADL